MLQNRLCLWPKGITALLVVFAHHIFKPGAFIFDIAPAQLQQITGPDSCAVEGEKEGKEWYHAYLIKEGLEEARKLAMKYEEEEGSEDEE